MRSLLRPSRSLTLHVALLAAFQSQAQTLPPTGYATAPYDAAAIAAHTVDLSAPVGVLEGAARVSPTGAATYTIPINVSPGTNGMQPQLAITYSSQAGNGQLGMGWGLAGLSAINRGGEDVENPDIPGQMNAPIEFVFEDEFYLDGERLVRTGTSPGGHGADGTAYDTQLARFMQCTSHGAHNNGPDHFTVVTKDGMRYWYGVDAQNAKTLTDDGLSEVLAWRLSQAMDPSGNYITYTYAEDPDASYNEHYLDRIDYTGNTAAGITPYNYIQFVYSRREDVSTAYVDGSAFHTTRLLDAVKVYCEGQHVRTYRLTYVLRDGESYLHEVSVSNAGETEWLNETIFQYATIPAASAFTSSFLGINDEESEFYSGDFDGNGISDLLKLYYWLWTDVDDADGDGTQQTVKNYSGFSVFLNGSATSSHDESLPATAGLEFIGTIQEVGITNNIVTTDYNGDGRDDVFFYKYRYDADVAEKWLIETFYVYESESVEGDADFAFQDIGRPHYSIKYFDPPQQYITAGDLNGDGRSEIFVSLWSVSWMISHPWIYARDPTPGSSGFTWQQQTFATTALDNTVANADNYYVLDYDGDGKFELIARAWDAMDEFRVMTMTEANYWEEVHSDPGIMPLKEDRLWVGDFNGDGAHDMLVLNWGILFYTEWNVYYSKAGGADHSNDWRSEPFNAVLGVPIGFGSEPEDRVLVADFNGDGRSDVYYDEGFGSNGFSIHYAAALGLGYPQFTEHPYGIPDGHPALDYALALGDFNGDGKQDLLHQPFARSGTIPPLYDSIPLPLVVYYFNKETHERLLEAISDGKGTWTGWEYKYMTDDDVYSWTGSSGMYTVGSRKIKAPMSLVSASATPNGVGGVHSNLYSYQDGWYNNEYRRFLGFDQTTVWDMSALMRTESRSQWTYYHRAPSSTKTFSIIDGVLLSETSMTNVTSMLFSLDFPYYYIHAGLTTTTDHLANATTTVEVTALDIYYNPERVETNVNGVETVVTETTWGTHGPYPRPSKPDEVKLTRTRGLSPSVSATTRYFYYSTTGLPYSTLEFFGTPKEHRFNFDYFSTGALRYKAEWHAGITMSTGRRTFLDYDSKHRFVTTRTDKWMNSGVVDLVTTSEYDERWGTVTKETTPDGLTIKHHYDGFGRRSSTSVPHIDGSPRYVVNYDLAWVDDDPNTPETWYSQVTDPCDAPDTRTYYDLLGREVASWTEGDWGNWSITTANYDAQGRPYQSTSPHFTGEAFTTTTTTYDDYNRVATVQNSLSGITQYDYSYSAGELTVEVTDPAGQISSKTTDAAGRVVKANDNGGQLTYTYDSWGNLTRVKHGGGTLSSMEYDQYGRQTQLIDLDAGTATYEYDAYGQLIHQVDANGNAVDLVYDNLGRLLTRTGPEGTTTYTYYYQAGRFTNDPVTIQGPGATYSYEYNDPYLRLTKETRTIDGNLYDTQYQYDDCDHVTQLSYPSGMQIQYTYNSDGSVYQVQTPLGTAFQALARNGLGQFTDYTLGDGNDMHIARVHGYPVQYVAGDAQDLNLEFDYETGNLMNRWDKVSEEQEIFTYDALNRLTSAHVLSVDAAGDPIAGGTDYTNTYTYDVFGGSQTRGNLMERADMGKFGYSGRHKVTSAYNISYPTPPDLPPQGMNAYETQTITYTHFQKTATVTEEVDGVNYGLEYRYGPDQHRVLSILNANSTETERRIYAGAFEKVIVNGEPHEVHYISGGDGLCAMIVHDPLASYPDDWKMYVVYKDHLGSIVTLTERVMVMPGVYEWVGTTRQNFDPWGRQRNPDDWTYTNLPTLPAWLIRGFTGHEHTDPFALINMNGRMYDPLNGRMLASDNFTQGVFNTQGFNRYSYAINNPLRYSDPTGEWVHLVIGAAIGGVLNWAFNGATLDAQGLGYFAVGAFAGAIGAGIGAGTGMVLQHGSFAAGFSGMTFPVAGGGFLGGVSGGFSGGFVGGFGNALLQGYAPSDAIGFGFRTGATGALIGGTIAGTSAMIQGQSFWTGNETFSTKVLAYSEANKALVRPHVDPPELVDRTPIHGKRFMSASGRTDSQWLRHGVGREEYLKSEIYISRRMINRWYWHRDREAIGTLFNEFKDVMDDYSGFSSELIERYPNLPPSTLFHIHELRSYAFEMLHFGTGVDQVQQLQELFRRSGGEMWLPYGEIP